MKVRAYVDYSVDGDELCILLNRDENTVVNLGFYDLEHKHFLDHIVNDFNKGFKTLWH